MSPTPWALWPTVAAWLVQAACVVACVVRWRRIARSELQASPRLQKALSSDRSEFSESARAEPAGPLRDLVIEVLDAPSAPAGMARLNEHMADVELETRLARETGAWARVALASGTAAALFVFAGGQGVGRFYWAGAAFGSGLATTILVLLLSRAARQRAQEIRDSSRRLAQRLSAMLQPPSP